MADLITMQVAAAVSQDSPEAIAVFADLCEKYTQSSGESISIADPNEAWILEIIGKAPKKVNGVNVNKGAVWVAVRIPDGYISGHANQALHNNFPAE